MNTRMFYSVIAIALCVFIFVLTSFIVTSEPLPLASDPYFHMQISRLYAQGNWTGAFNYIQSVNQIPFYPPLFHVLIIPFVLQDPYTGLRILEMIFFPVTFTLIAWLMWKQAGPKATVITGLILLGCWSFLDGTLQARPESLDLLLYPLIIMALLKAKKKTFVALAVASIYNHGLAALTNVIGFAVKKLREKTWRKTILAATLITLPILILSAYYFTGAYSMWSSFRPTENPQETLFWTMPWPWIPYYSGLTLFGFAFLLLKSKTEFETLLKYGIIGNLIMLPFWADRWLQYSSIPLAMLMGIGASRWHGWKLYLFLGVVALVAWAYVSQFILISLQHSWWQPGYFISSNGGA